MSLFLVLSTVVASLLGVALGVVVWALVTISAAPPRTDIARVTTTDCADAEPADELYWLCHFAPMKGKP